MASLAKRTDVEAILGRNLTTSEALRIDAILAKLSELFIQESGQQFLPGESHVELKANAGRTYLPQRPVTEVYEVTDVRGREISGWRLFHQWLDLPRPLNCMIRVNYAHGSDTVPELVVTTIADAARQVLEISPEAVSGLTQLSETTGPFTTSNSYASWSLGGATRLSPEDKAVARSFRPKLGKTWVGAL